MKKFIYTLIFGFFSVAAFSQFTPGNLVVGVAGNGATALSSAAAVFTLTEYNTGGTATGYSVAVPSTGANAFTVSGTTGQEGQLNLSPDGLYVSYAGYNTAFGVAGNVSSNAANRAFGYTSNNGTTVVTNYPIFKANNSRGAVYDGCSAMWAVGAGSAANFGGVEYVGSGHAPAVAAAEVSTAPNTSNRAVGLFNNQLYYSTQTAPFGIWTVDSSTSGMPTTGPNTAVSLIATAGGAASLPYGFYFNTAGTICYVADDRATADSSAGNGCKVTSGGIQKYIFTGGVWKYQYTLPVAANAVTTGAIWLTVDFSGANPVIYAISGEASANRLVKVTDVNNNSNYTLLATAPTNDLFKGICFSPSAVTAPTQDNNVTFSSVTSSTLTASWTNNGGAGHEVFINTSNSFVAPSGVPGTGNPAYGGSGRQLVYSGTGSSVNITGLTPNTTYYVEVYAYNQTNCTYGYNPATATNNPNNTTTSPAPGLFVSPGSLAFGTIAVNNTLELSYTLSGIGLSSNVTVTAPSGYGVSLVTGGPYTSSVSVTETAGNANATIYVGFTPASATSFPGNVTNVSGIYSQNVGVTGTGANPTIAVSGAIAFGNQLVGTTSFEQSFTVSGTNLISDITITAPSGYLVSTSPCTGFAATADVVVAGTGVPQGATLASTTVYVEFVPTSAGSFANNIVASATGAGNQNQAASGTGVTATSFSNSNLAVLTIGTGCSSLSSSGTPGTVWEFTSAGARTGFQTVVPSSGGNKITFSGSASYDGPLTLSPDSVMLSFGGYNAAAGAASVTSGTQARAVGTITNSGLYNAVLSSTLFNTTNCRQAVTDGCSNYWVSGNSLPGQGGVAYFGESNAASYAETAADSTNARGAFYLNGTVYFSTASANTQINPGIYSLGNMPYTAQSYTTVISTGVGSSPAGFFFNNAKTICYVADDRATVDSASGTTVASGGIQKYALVAGNWVYQYTLQVSANGVLGARWLTVDFGGANPIIYATTAEAAAPNRLVKITDNGRTASFTLLSTSGANYIYRGVAFTPTAVAPTVQDHNIVFSSIVGDSMTVSWTNGNGSKHLVRIDTANSFTHPNYDTIYNANRNYTQSGMQAVYFGTGNSVTITNLSPNQVYWIRVFGANTRNCTTAYDTAIAVNNPLPNANLWTGANSIDWNTGSNWASGVIPVSACGTNVVIQAGTPFSPTLSAAASVGDLSVAAGAVLTLNADLSSCGNINGGGSSHSDITGTGKLVLNGTSSQSITRDLHVTEIQLNNPAGAVMQTGSTLHVSVAMDLTKGNFNATNGTLNFTSSSPVSVGIIDNFTVGNTGTLTGNITAERYYNSSSTYNQHMIGSPVNAPALTQFGVSGTQGYVVALPDCDESQVVSWSPYGTLFGYNEGSPQASICGVAQWKNLSAGNAVNGVGYSYRVAGSGTLALFGAANLNATYTVSALTNSNWANTSLQGRHMSSGWSLLSNPYLATLNLTTVNAGFDNQIQVWNDSGSFAGTYQPGTIGSSATVAPFQAFMVHKTATGGSLSYTIKATDRTRTAATFFNQNDNELNIVAENTGNGLLDQTTVAFNSNATDEFDALLDADKLAGSLDRHTIYTTNASNTERWLARNTLNSIAATNTVPLGFEPGVSGSYKLNFNNINTFDATSYIILEDRKLNVMYNVRSGAYTFTSDANDGWDRFVLHFTPATIINTVNATCSTAGSISISQPGTSNWSFSVTDANHLVLSSGVLSQSNPVNLDVQAGNYTLVLTDNDNYTVTKSVMVGGAQDVSAAFNASSNNVTTQTEIQFTNSSQNASSVTWNFGDGTSATSSNTAHVYATAGTYTVTLTAASAGGCLATASQTIHVTGNATGIGNVAGNGTLTMWSNENKVYVDFTQLGNVNAVVKIYDILGREISNDKFTSATLYQKEINNLDAAYVIVSVVNQGNVETRKLFITNTK